MSWQWSLCSKSLTKTRAPTWTWERSWTSMRMTSKITSRCRGSSRWWMRLTLSKSFPLCQIKIPRCRSPWTTTWLTPSLAPTLSRADSRVMKTWNRWRSLITEWPSSTLCSSPSQWKRPSNARGSICSTWVLNSSRSGLRRYYWMRTSSRGRIGGTWNSSVTKILLMLFERIN